MSKPQLYPEPIQGIRIIEPVSPPAVDDELLGYEIVEVETDDTCHAFTKPRPDRMNIGGWILFGVTLLFFWPLSCCACCIKSSYDTVQRPVYGKPKQD